MRILVFTNTNFDSILVFTNTNFGNFLVFANIIFALLYDKTTFFALYG